MKAQQRKLARLQRLARIRDVARHEAATRAAEAEDVFARIVALDGQTNALARRYEVKTNAAQIDGDQSELVINFAVGGANTYRFRGNVVPGRRWRDVDGAVIWGRLYDLGNRTQIRILDTDLVPFEGGTVDEHTRQFRLRARIRNFNGMRGCSVTAVLMLYYWNRPE